MSCRVLKFNAKLNKKNGFVLNMVEKKNKAFRKIITDVITNVFSLLYNVNNLYFIVYQGKINCLVFC